MLFLIYLAKSVVCTLLSGYLLVISVRVHFIWLVNVLLVGLHAWPANIYCIYSIWPASPLDFKGLQRRVPLLVCPFLVVKRL